MHLEQMNWEGVEELMSQDNGRRVDGDILQRAVPSDLLDRQQTVTPWHRLQLVTHKPSRPAVRRCACLVHRESPTFCIKQLARAEMTRLSACDVTHACQRAFAAAAAALCRH